MKAKAWEPQLKALSIPSESKQLKTLKTYTKYPAYLFAFKPPQFFKSSLCDMCNEFRSGSGGDRIGLGANAGEADEDDDEFDTYRKRMMLSYRFRPNPMNNPRRQYY